MMWKTRSWHQLQHLEILKKFGLVYGELECQRRLRHLCRNCKRKPKNTVHTLWDCEKIWQVWERDFDGLQATSTQELSFTNLFGLIALRPRGLELFIMIP